MLSFASRSGLAAGCLLLVSCTPASPYRTALPDPPPDCTESPQACNASRHEHTKDYDLLFVEFDDQGLLYPNKLQGDKPPADIDEIMAALKKLGERYEQQGISLIVFVHGWQHNASSNDPNVEEFRKALAYGALVEEAKPSHQRRVVGIYVGWRGLSSTVQPFQVLSFWERKATAQYVAQGSARSLLTRLKSFQRGVNCRVKTDCIAGEPKPGGRSKIRLIMIGHSFGGLILFNAISESLVEGLTSRQDSGDPGAPVVRFGDMVILLNPAFEATRYTPIHRIVTSDARPFPRYQAPILVSITSMTDWATGLAFPAGRVINTTFEIAKSREESAAIKNTMGHVTQYKTHHLSSQDPSSQANPCPGWKPAATVEEMRNDLAAEETNDKRFFGSDGRPVLKDQWVRTFCGGAVLKHENYQPNSPVWNVEAEKSVIDGHGDIWRPTLWSFLRQLYKDSESYPIE